MAPDLQTRLTQGMTFAQLLERSRHASLLLAFLEAAPPEPLPEEVAWVLALVEVQTAEKQPTNPHTSSLGPPAPNELLFRSQPIQEYKTSRRAAKEAKGGKMNPGMPKGAAPKLFLGVHARLVFLKKEDEQAVLDLMRRFSSATRFAYNRLLEGQDRKELKREDGPLCTLFGLNTRYADGAIEKAQATLDSAKELGQDPRKVVFGGRELFEQLKRKHLSGKALLALKREWKERRQGLLYSRGDATKKGNANLRLEPQGDALWLRVNLGNGAYVHAQVRTSHPQLKALLQRAYASLPYNVTIRLEDGKVYAHFTWSEGLPPPVHTKANGVLGIDVNGDPYHLALAVVGKDGKPDSLPHPLPGGGGPGSQQGGQGTPPLEGRPPGGGRRRGTRGRHRHGKAQVPP
jgi:predicted transposase